MSSAHQHSEAVLVGSIAYGEADRIVTLFTRDLGKVSAMARSARRSRTRFGAALSFYVVGEASLRERHGAELMLLDGFDARRDLSGLGVDVVKLGHASYATELVRELTAPHRPDPPLFDLLVELYEVVAACVPRAGTLRAFELHLLDEIGLRPALDRCVSCDREDDLDRAVLDPARGGLVCPRCPPGAGLRLLDGAARARLLELRHAPSLAAAAALPVAPPAIEDSARRAMHALVAAHLSRPIRSLEFLRKLAGHV